MANFNAQSLVFAFGLALLTDASQAAQPPDTVDSDSNGNSAMGGGALIGMGSAAANTASGFESLYVDTTGSYNTALGAGALKSNTTADGNTGLGYVALSSNTTGASNTAVGSGALQNNSEGNENSAFGSNALTSNTTGIENSASGYRALFANTTGPSNTASGYDAMYTNTTGANNTAFGANALYSNSEGKGNAAQGVNALYYNSTGIRNLGIGSNALFTNTTGSYNIALGFDAGYNVTTGSNNIEIGTEGNASDNNTIQIGVQGTQTQASIAGIYGTPVTGAAIYVTSSGQLGVQASSERYKTDIATMPALSDKLSQLRPVTFHYKTDPNGLRQYGLIAEEVDKVYPELVIRDKTGKIQGVHYEELAPMLLNELQRQHAAMQTQSRKANADAGRIDAEELEIHALTQLVSDQALQLAATRDQAATAEQQVAELMALKHEMQVALLELQGKKDFLAKR